MRKSLIAGCCAMLMSAGVFAAQCPADMKQIDEAMSKSPMLSAEQMAEVKQLRMDGEAMHKAGKHKESMEALGKAKKMLNIGM